MEIEDVVTANRAQQARARELNLRAGEEVFPVLSWDEIHRWLKTRLGGARRLAEVKNLADLAFPELDPERVKLVTSKNPDEITINGRTYPVEYREDCIPRITLEREMVVAHVWRDLPDADVKLPGGRLVEVVVPFGHYDTVRGTEIPELKSRCYARANRSLWESWPEQGRPAIALPDPSDPMSVVPEIVTAQYGTSAIDGSPLLAYGTVALKAYRYYGTDPYFEVKWFQLRQTAVLVHVDSVAKLESLREEVIKQKRLDDAREAARAALEELRGLMYVEGWIRLDPNFRSRVTGAVNTFLPVDIDDLDRLVKATRSLIYEAKGKLRASARTASPEKAQVTIAALRAKFGGR